MNDTYFLMELTDKGQLVLKTGGNPALWAQMLRQAMDTKPEIAAMAIAATLQFAKDKNINSGDLGNVIKLIP